MSARSTAAVSKTTIAAANRSILALGEIAHRNPNALTDKADVTELSHDAYRAALEALPTGVYLVDHERRILLWSRGAEELTGYRAAEVVGRCYRDDLLIHGDESARGLDGGDDGLQQTMHDGVPRTADMFLLHKDGYRVPVRVHAAPLHDSLGAIVGAIGCFDRRHPFHPVEHHAGHPSLVQAFQTAKQSHCASANTCRRTGRKG
ncbi:MAG: PAS domain-containing protein [Ignavibacteriota bacterium]